MVVWWGKGQGSACVGVWQCGIGCTACAAADLAPGASRRCSARKCDAGCVPSWRTRACPQLQGPPTCRVNVMGCAPSCCGFPTLVKMISLPCLRSSSALRYSSPRTAYCVVCVCACGGGGGAQRRRWAHTCRRGHRAHRAPCACAKTKDRWAVVCRRRPARPWPPTHRQRSRRPTPQRLLLAWRGRGEGTSLQPTKGRACF